MHVSLQLLNLFKKNFDESNHKPNKTWAGKGREFYNRSMKLSL